MSRYIDRLPLPRSGAAAAPTPHPDYARLLRRRAKPLRADFFLAVADWLAAERRNTGRTQKAVALQYRIPLRQVKTYEAIARWPREAKALVASAPEKFLVSDLTRLFANRSWQSKEALLNALKRHAAGKPPRKQQQHQLAHLATDPNVLAVQDRLRERLLTRIELTGDGQTGEIRIAYFSIDQLEKLLALLEA